MAAKRTDYLAWQDYFMAVAFLAAKRSKDPQTQIGACIVNSANKIVGLGYNGMPKGCSDDDFPWTRSGPSYVDTKYPFVVNAETNAILNKNSASLKGCDLYTALFPNNESAKLIIQAGIRRVFYYADRYPERAEYIAARMLFDAAGVEACQYKPSQNRVTLDFDVVQYQMSGQPLPASPERTAPQPRVSSRPQHVHSPLRISTYPVMANADKDDYGSDDDILTPADAQEAREWLEAMESDPANHLASALEGPPAGRSHSPTALRRASLPGTRSHQSSEATRKSLPASPMDPKERALRLQRSLARRRSARNSLVLPTLLKHAHSSPQLAQAIHKTNV
eukprot:m.42397 g.42397  ORF g.42397 m.42397 type:complete len:336 (-) comp12877_c0_seq1:1327-2334(-)